MQWSDGRRERVPRALSLVAVHCTLAVIALCDHMTLYECTHNDTGLMVERWDTAKVKGVCEWNEIIKNTTVQITKIYKVINLPRGNYLGRTVTQQCQRKTVQLRTRPMCIDFSRNIIIYRHVSRLASRKWNMQRFHCWRYWYVSKICAGTHMLSLSPKAPHQAIVHDAHHI